MTDNWIKMPQSQIWLILLGHIMLNATDPVQAALKVDAFLEEYNKRWSKEHG